MCGAWCLADTCRHRTMSGKTGPCPPLVDGGSRTACGPSKVPLGQIASKGGPSDAAQGASCQRHRGLASQPPLRKTLQEGGALELNWVIISFGLQHPPRFAGNRGKSHSIWRRPVVRAWPEFPKPMTRHVPLPVHL